MTYMEISFHFLKFMWLKKVAGRLSQLSLFMEKAALAAYVSGSFHRRFAMRKLDHSIYLVVSRTPDSQEYHVGSIFLETGDIQDLLNNFMLKQKESVIFSEDLATFRWKAILAANSNKVVPL